MQRDALAGWRNHLESFQHGACRRRRNLAERIAHIELEADDAAGDEIGHVGDRVLAKQPIEAIVDMSRLAGELMFFRQNFLGADGRDGIGHIEDGGDAAIGCRRRSGAEVFLVRIARVAEM